MRESLPMAVCVLWLVSLLSPAAGRAEDRGHLDFFHENRTFILEAFEKLPTAKLSGQGEARHWDFDPFAEWQAGAAVRKARATLDTASTPEQLLQFSGALDSLLLQAAQAADRLDDLDHRFATHLRTSLEVTLEAGRETELQRVEAWLNGERRAEHEITAEERAALRAGGVLEVVRTVVEPRQQNLLVVTYLQNQAEPKRYTTEFQPTADALLRLHVDLQKDETQFQSTLVHGGP